MTQTETNGGSGIAAHGRPDARRVILRNMQSPGDIVMLTAAVRDLMKAHPGRFLVDVRTSCPALWENNPYLSPLSEWDSGVRVIECSYPLIHASNSGSYHFVHGFRRHLEDELQVRFPATDMKGDIHLDDDERRWMSQVEEVLGIGTRFWIIVAGGKYDYSAKWWSQERFQQVVDALLGRVLFVQVGAAEHHHPPLRNVLDLRGKTDLRQLVRLVHHADGVVCGVTLLMHLAAAVETRAGRPPVRGCVVIAGGREPPQWEAYPHHAFLHTVGILPCCAAGGCWRSRTVALGDGDPKDLPDQLCVDVRSGLQRCMELITPQIVVSAVERYYAGGMLGLMRAPTPAGFTVS